MAKKPTRRELYSWMDKQIEACFIQNTPVDPTDHFYICNASGHEKEVQVYGIDRLIERLGVSFEVAEHSPGFKKHYFVYRGYTFFGLVGEEEE